jgi:hypothetical protein
MLYTTYKYTGPAFGLATFSRLVRLNNGIECRYEAPPAGTTTSTTVTVPISISGDPAIATGVISAFTGIYTTATVTKTGTTNEF